MARVFSKRKFKVCEEVDPVDGSRKIPLTRGYFAIVDACDYDRLNWRTWYASVQPGGLIYAARAGKSEKTGRLTTVMMHREVLGLGASEDRRVVVDHINQGEFGGLDNRRKNLRVVDQSTNCARRRFRGGSDCVGVYPVYRVVRGTGERMLSGKWWAQVWVPYRKSQARLGIFPSKEEAMRARDEAAVRLLGPEARLNIKS